MSDDDYGRKVGQALAAVRRMHADVSKLLVDVEGTIGKGKASVFGSYSTRDLSSSFRDPRWMAWFVYRYFAAGVGADPSVVDAVTVWFFDNDRRIEEPHLLVGQLCYELEAGQQQVKGMCQEWDLPRAYIHWAGPPTPGRVHVGRSPQDRPVIRWYKVIAVPLFSITSMAGVVELMDRVRATDVPPPQIPGLPSDAGVDGAGPGP
jgi:hypothetical protein